MKIKMSWKGMTAAAGVALMLIACNKENTGPMPEEEIISAEDNQSIIDETEAVFTYNDELFGGLSSLRESAETGTDSVGNPGKRPLKADKCATVSRTESNGIITIVVDYGTAKECEGRKVGGKMTIQIPVKPPRDASGLFTQNITYQNFQRGPRIINGKHTINLALENGRVVTKEDFTETTITTEDGKTITFSSTKTRKEDAKGTPLNRADDEILVTGSTTATGSDGKTFKSTITKVLITKVACRGTGGIFPVSGTIEIERPDKPKTVVDYGDGNCDRTYTVTSDGKTITKSRK